MRCQVAFPHPRRQRRIGFAERGIEQPQIQIRKFGRPVTFKINHAHGSSPNVSPGRRANWHRASPREVTNRKECATDWPGFRVRIMISRRRLRGIASRICVVIVRDFFVSQDFNRAGNILAKIRCGCRTRINPAGPCRRRFRKTLVRIPRQSAATPSGTGVAALARASGRVDSTPQSVGCYIQYTRHTLSQKMLGRRNPTGWELKKA
jgi:hypothetical protein